MNLETFQRQTTEALTAIYGREEASSLCKVMITEVLGYKPFEMSLRRSEVLESEDLLCLQQVVERLLAHEPLQYILGRAWFGGMHLQVNKHTLIPRQETEELVAWITGDGVVPGAAILDIGTGSGCIAIALAKAFEKVNIDAVDVSTEALKVARENAREQGAEVRFLQKDILEVASLADLRDREDDPSYEVIVSNPPYVRNLEKEEIAPHVLDHEPGSALFVSDDDPLIFYRKIASLAYANLLKGGRLYFEINQYLGPETEALLRETGFTEVELRKDLLGNFRMIKAVK
ncbi:peptide chain release factor N(5)-glutamine methyltransferase [Robertkochia sediminum]|uniref:peptide chain release factor N(5)-glutamine methyltransferase n=1 Tax=Robertkochia sediminum TaxID=2785326 RepID=UPI001932B330|nr:peptide chain release factor N(5)-glutamine methyltransferase [Robertkochia sediminum]MBL7473684.1 peptide chain release factor N(5)-glutamine methyltransferase [Robertkochia sediminum]